MKPAGRHIQVIDQWIDQVAFTAEQIAYYLKNHPSAADSAEGIQRWWIPRQLCEAPLDLVQRALNRLEAEGMIERTVIGGTVIYRRAPKPQAG